MSSILNNNNDDDDSIQEEEEESKQHHHTVDNIQGLFNPCTPTTTITSLHKLLSSNNDVDSALSSVQNTRKTARDYILSNCDSEDNSEKNSENEESEQESEEESGEESGEEEELQQRPRKQARPESLGYEDNHHQDQQQKQQKQDFGGNKCFLCDYCTSNEVKFVSSFISDNIANMDVMCMAKQIQCYILEKRPEFSQGSHGLEVVSIRKHIRQHMLSPTVRIADMMRHLLNLLESMRGNLERVDEETGESSADRSNIDIYLKVVTKVLDMYKMSETNKMLFANVDSK